MTVPVRVKLNLPVLKVEPQTPNVTTLADPHGLFRAKVKPRLNTPNESETDKNNLTANVGTTNGRTTHSTSRYEPVLLTSVVLPIDLGTRRTRVTHMTTTHFDTRYIAKTNNFTNLALGPDSYLSKVVTFAPPEKVLKTDTKTNR